MPHLISVCIPAYRQPELLQRAVESVLMQKECNFEIIITDDTEENTSPLLESRDKRIHYFKNRQRLGATQNWNESISKANGNIIKILHHDDWFTANTGLIETTQSIINEKCDVTFCACNAVGEKEDFLFYHHIEPIKLEQILKAPINLLWGNLIGAPSLIAIKKEIHKPFDPKFTWLADIDYYINILSNKNIRSKYINNPVINVTSNSGQQLSRQCEVNKLLSAKENIDLFKKHYTCYYPNKRMINHFKEIANNLSISDNLDSILYSLKSSKKTATFPLFIGLLRNTAKATHEHFQSNI